LGVTFPNNQPTTYDNLLQAIASSSSSDNDKIAVSSLRNLNSNKAFTKPLIQVSNPNAKALGLIVNNGNAIDARIFINNNLASYLQWDYNSNDNTNSPKDQSKKDFIGVLSHEVGHALGFITAEAASPLDLFRFIPPDNTIPKLGGDGIRKYFSIDGGITPENYFQFDDDNHFSQYKDNTDTANEKVKTVVGLMSPSILPRQDNNKI
jgi:hypothetical protein